MSTYTTDKNFDRTIAFCGEILDCDNETVLKTAIAVLKTVVKHNEVQIKNTNGELTFEIKT